MPKLARSFLVPFLLLAIPLGILATLGFVATQRQLARTRDAATARTVEAVTALVSDYQESLRRETGLLAQDPVVIEGTSKGDWATLARGASPRGLAVTRDALADFVTIRDARDAPLVQVPAAPPPGLPVMPGSTEPTVVLALAGDRPYFLATAPIFGADDRGGRTRVGTVVAGRRVEGLASVLDRLPTRPVVLFLADDRALGGRRAELPATGWSRAATLGATEIAGQPFRLRRLAPWAAGPPDGALWVLVPEGEFARAERRLVLEFVALLAAGVVVLGGVVLAFMPASPASADGARGPLERRNRELEALNAISATIGLSADLVTTAEETLEVVRRLARMDVGLVYRLDPEGRRLILLAQRGLKPEFVERARTRPVEGSYMGEAIRTGQLLVTHLDASPPADAGMREIAAERAHRTQLALPILVENRTWGVMVLVSREQRQFAAEEMATLAAAARQVGVGVERAQLQEVAAARRNRLEAQRLIERHISEQLDLEQLLVVIAESAQRLIGGGYAAVYLLDGDRLRARAWSDIGEWIRDVSVPIGTGAAGTAVASGRGVLVNDYPGSPLAIPAFVPFTGRLMAQPLMARGRAVGVLSVGRESGAPPFTEEDLSTLADLATQAAVALENARLFAEATRSAAQHEALFEVSGLVSSTLEVQGVLDVIAERSRALLGVAGAGIFRLDRTSGYLLYERGIGLSAELVSHLRVRPGEGTTGRSVEERRPVWTEDILADPAIPLRGETRALVEREGYRAVLSVPIVSKGEAYGALAAYWWEPHVSSPAEISVMTALAGQAAVALDNARLYEAATARGKRLNTLAALTRTLTATLSLEEVLNRVTRAAVELFGSSVSHLWLVDEGGDTLSLRAHAGTTTSVPRITRFRLGEGLMGEIVAQRRPLVVPDLRQDQRVRNVERTRAEGAVSFAGVPLLLGDRVLGALSIAVRELHPFSDEDLSLLQSLADHAAIAIENARLFSQERDRKGYLASLLDINKKIGALASTETLLASIAEEAARLLDVDNAGFRLLDGDELVLAGLAGTAVETMKRPRLKVGESLSGKVVAAGHTVMCEIESDPTLIPEHLMANRRLGYTHYLGVPLLVGDRAIGVLTFRGRRAFTARDQDIAETFAGQAAIALDHARLYREATEQAERMRAMAELGRTLVSTLDEGQILQTVTSQARETLDVVEVGICLQDQETGLLRLVAGAGFADEFVKAHVLEPGEGVAGRAMAEGQPVWTSDVLQDPGIHFRPESRRRLEVTGTRAILALPLVRERPFGALLVYRPAGYRFTEREIQYLSAFANQVAVALENARLYEALDVRAARLRTLARLAHIVSASLDMDEVLGAIARAAAELIDVPVAAFWVADEVGQTLDLRTVSDEGLGRAILLQRITFDQGAAGWVARHRQRLEIEDVFTDDRFLHREWAAAHGLRAFIGVPIMFQDSLLGVLVLTGRRPIHLGPDDQELLESFVAQAGVAIRNARLYAETRGRLEQTRALLEVAEILSSALDSRRLLREAAIKIAQVCRVDRCTVERWAEGRVVPLISQYADGRVEPERWAKFLELVKSLPPDLPLHRRAVETRRPVVTPDAAAGGLIPPEWVEAFDIKSSMTVPMIRQGEVIGVMTLDHTERATPFAPWQVELATAIAGQLALSLENTRMYVELEQRLHETTTLLAVGRALSRPGPAVEVMRGVAREGARAFGADMAGVYALDGKREALIPLAGYHVPKHLLDLFRGRRFALSRVPALAQAWSEGRAVWSSDADQDPRFDQEALAGVGPHSVLFVPTTVRGEPVGALFLVWWQRGRQFSDSEIRLIEGVASQIGLALENADLARQTQEKLQETETLLSVSQTVSSTLDLETLPRQFLRHVVQALGADAAGLWLLEEDGEWLAPLAGYHIPPDRLEAIRRLRLSIVRHPLCAEAARTRQAVVSTDLANDPRVPEEMRAAAPVRTFLFAPIVAKDRLIGGLAAGWWETHRELSEVELRLVEAVASQAGVALENARLFRDNQQRVEELSVLHELSRAVTGQLDQAGLLEAIHRQLARLLEVEHFVIVLHNDATDELEVALRVRNGVRDTSEPLRYPRRGVGLMSATLDSGQSIRTSDYLGECGRRGLAPTAAGAGLPHWLGVPMAAGNRVLGVMALRSRERAFAEADERLLSNIAHLAALALRSARLFEDRARAFGELAAAQDQLVRTEKLRALGEMASGVAHDFNNVLTSILGRAQLLLERVQDPKLHRWLQVIERSALDGARTVRRLQDFTGIRRDQPAVPVDLNQVIQQVMETTAPTWRQETRRRGIEIDVTIDLAQGLPKVAGDPADLREAFTNLVLNAVDAMPRGGRLTLHTAARDGQVEVAVTDTGVGIPEAIRQKIFDPFFTTKGPQGTGLGLSMTYGILSRHSARITVESEEGRGTTFRLIFPATDQEAQAAAVAPPGSSAPLHCLVVDDETAVAEVVSDILTAAGHTAVVTRNGREAVERLGAEAFDLVFTDLAMPGMTGWEVARAVKDAAPEVPVVMMSGFGVEVAPEELRAHGVAVVLSKPLQIPDVLGAVASVRSAATRTPKAGGRS